MSVSPQPHRPSCPKSSPLSLSLQQVTKHFLNSISTKPYRATTYTFFPIPATKISQCSLYITMCCEFSNSAKVPNALLSHCWILNQTFLQELPKTNAGLTTTTSTFMSKNHSPPLAMQQSHKTLSEDNLHQAISKRHTCTCVFERERVRVDETMSRARSAIALKLETTSTNTNTDCIHTTCCSRFVYRLWAVATSKSRGWCGGIRGRPPRLSPIMRFHVSWCWLGTRLLLKAFADTREGSQGTEFVTRKGKWWEGIVLCTSVRVLIEI